MKNAPLGREVLARSYFMPDGKSQSSTSVWTNPDCSGAHQFASVFILVITRNLDIRTMVESDLAAVARARCLNTTRSVDIYPMCLMDEGAPAPPDLWAKVCALGCDAICTVTILNVKSEQRYVHGTCAYAPFPGFPYYNKFESYYGGMLPAVSSPEYYKTENTYFLEGNLFDAATGRIQWSMQSIDWDPSELVSFSTEFARLVVDQLNMPKELQH